MNVIARGMGALGTNPALGVNAVLTLHGSDWLWAVTALYIVVFFGILVLCIKTPEADRMFHILFTCSLLVGCVAYFAQASDLGWSAVDGRQLFWAKYVNWAVAFPAAALALGLLSDVSWTTIFSNMFFCWLWVVSYLVGAYTASAYKWGFFAFGTFAWLILVMSTLNESREAAERKGMARDYILLAGLANVLWLLYPVAWALGDGSGTISVTASFVFVGVLDLLQLPVFSVAFVLLARKWNYARLNLDLSESRSGWRSVPVEDGGKPDARREPAVNQAAAAT